MRHSSFFLIFIFITLLAGGCGQTTPTIPESVISVNQTQIETSDNFDSLLKLYKQSSALLQGKDKTQYANDFTTLKKMGEKLVSLKQNDIGEMISQSALKSGEVPLANLLKQKESITNSGIEGVNWQPLLDTLNTHISKTNSAITERKSALEGDTVSDADKLVLLDDLHKLSDDPLWLKERNQLIDDIVEEIRQAKIEGNLTTDLREKIDLVRENRPDDQVLAKELIAVSAEIYQQDYFKALSEGDADKAYSVFITMSESKDFEQIKSNLTDSSQKMVDYFVALADASVKEPSNLSQSYRWYNQARVVTQKLDLKSKPLEGEVALTEQLMAKFTELKEAQLDTIAFAYLHYVKEFSPTYKGLRQMLSEQEEKVNSLAIKRISTTKFSGTEQQGYSDVVSSNITQYMFTNIPNDVRIVEREQYEAIIREKDLGGNQNNLTAVDLLVTGSILDAKVDTTKTEGKKIMRVTVGQEEIPNPAYVSWLELSARERKKVEKPSATIKVDKQENVSANITKHRKVGIFSVSYRLVDAASGRILYPDSITEEQEYSDESREGVEMGDFKMEFKLADLPSDVKILDGLAKTVSEKIGSSLVEKLKDQDSRYMAEADEFANDKSCDKESDRLAKALVIMKAKGKDRKAVFDRYKDVTINCPI